MEITKQNKLFGCKRVNILLHGSGYRFIDQYLRLAQDLFRIFTAAWSEQCFNTMVSYYLSGSDSSSALAGNSAVIKVVAFFCVCIIEKEIWSSPKGRAHT
ncbi:hypothetical protein SDC9_123340 [bioreactor metagenome]|uniref:Uncharacterized protein n=1 Tax=bioreactor metagenome TaxID=1076179 RepID=A0A645CHI3_9ZZZZ